MVGGACRPLADDGERQLLCGVTALLSPVFAATTMLCFFTVGVFGVSLVCWLIASLTAWGRFSDYCDVVAKVEGR